MKKGYSSSFFPKDLFSQFVQMRTWAKVNSLGSKLMRRFDKEPFLVVGTLQK